MGFLYRYDLIKVNDSSQLPKWIFATYIVSYSKTKAFVIASSSATITSFASAFLFYITATLSVSPPEAVSASTAPAYQALIRDVESAQTKKNRPPTITTHSSPSALALGKELKNLNAKMYGAFWCSHCFNQKQELGQEVFVSSIKDEEDQISASSKKIDASSGILYIECAKDGYNSQYKLCREKDIPGYPTWEIDGKYYPGEKSLSELKQLVAKINKSKN